MILAKRKQIKEVFRISFMITEINHSYSQIVIFSPNTVDPRRNILQDPTYTYNTDKIIYSKNLTMAQLS